MALILIGQEPWIKYFYWQNILLSHALIGSLAEHTQRMRDKEVPERIWLNGENPSSTLVVPADKRLGMMLQLKPAYSCRQ